jgi:hypothetical protein
VRGDTWQDGAVQKTMSTLAKLIFFYGKMAASQIQLRKRFGPASQK